MKKVLLVLSYALVSVLLLSCKKDEQPKPVETKPLLSSIIYDGRFVKEFFYNAEKQLIETKSYDLMLNEIASINKYSYTNKNLSKIEETLYLKYSIDSVNRTRIMILNYYPQYDYQGRIITFYQDALRSVKAKEFVYNSNNFVQEYKMYENGVVLLSSISSANVKGNLIGLETKSIGRSSSSKCIFEYNPDTMYKSPYSLLPSWMSPMDYSAEYPQKYQIEHEGAKQSYTNNIEINSDQYVTKVIQTNDETGQSLTIVFKYQ